MSKQAYQHLASYKELPGGFQGFPLEETEQVSKWMDEWKDG